MYSMAGSLWRQKVDSKQAMQMTDGAGYDYQPDWSPDGKSVVYVSYQKDAMELWLLDCGERENQAIDEWRRGERGTALVARRKKNCLGFHAI